ncbi:amino acid permease C-terminal domain-containing protein [Domibacillus aminovorans]
MPGLAILFCGFLIFRLGAATWIRFAIWLAIGVVIYFSYSQKQSKLNNDK